MNRSTPAHTQPIGSCSLLYKDVSKVSGANKDSPRLLEKPYTLGLQGPSKKVFGVGLDGPNTFWGGTWSPRDTVSELVSPKPKRAKNSPFPKASPHHPLHVPASLIDGSMDLGIPKWTTSKGQSNTLIMVCFASSPAPSVRTQPFGGATDRCTATASVPLRPQTDDWQCLVCLDC